MAMSTPPGRAVNKAAYVLGIVLGSLFFVGCIYYAMAPHAPGRVEVLLCFAGGALGWFVGILISPRDEDEKAAFVNYGKAISAFVTGFVLAKLDRIFEDVMRPENLPKAGEDYLVRTLLFVTTFVIGVLFTFVGRGYGFRRPR